METNNFNNENILCSINCYKAVKNSEVAISFIANLFAGGVAGSVTNDFRLTLTDRNLYIETIGYCAWGGLPEVISVEKIPRGDVKSFKVKSVDSNEVIELTPNQNKTIVFIRDNEKNDNLALKMSSII
ncbi:hypothetical protein [Faecalimicrobium dakarense]|uniref:hypothetical protein n=1 Tax=Faecalimicrobium dakarense TaxID=1301100 RepID=UPI0004B8C273|nr:hypothetical protein [[Clostridium] dakarense]